METLMSTLDAPRVALPEPVAARPRRHVPVWLAIVAASLPMFMATLDNLVMTSALPVIDADLHASVGQLSWFMNAYTLTFATFMLPAATLGDRLGRRRMMLAGVTLFTLASIASALSTTSEALIAARAVQGLGAAAIMPLSLTLLAAAVPPAMRAAAIGIWGGVSGLGVALGPVIGGAVVEGVSWQAIFWLNVPVALVAVPLLLVAIPESRGLWQRLDVAGTLLFGGAVFLGIWGIVHGNDDGWSDPRVVVPLVLAGALLPAYYLWARGHSYAVLPLRLFSERKFTVANVIFLMFTLGMFGTVFLLAQYLQIVQGYSPLEAGIRTLPWTAAPMVVAPIAGALVGRLGYRSLLLTGLVLQTARRAPGRRLRDRQLGELHDPGVRCRTRHRRPGRGVPRQRRRALADRVRRRDRAGPAHRRRRGRRRRGRRPLRPGSHPSLPGLTGTEPPTVSLRRGGRGTVMPPRA
jgi:EmrB/QacA subfamily drug resistance transporter